MQTHTEHLRSGIVWIATGVFLLIYGILGLFQTNIPGIADLIAFIESAKGGWLFLAAFLSIFFEGLYIIGSFFPGTTVVLVIAILGQIAGWAHFIGIIAAVYIGWIAAGSVNILGAKAGSSMLQKKTQHSDPETNAGLTWFPAFRANQEVAQVIAGYSARRVFISTLRIKTITCAGLIVYALIIPFIIDLATVSNEEGFRTISILAFINLLVGSYKVHKYYKLKKRPKPLLSTLE